MDIQKGKKLSIDEAIELLYNHRDSSYFNEIFDIYGNYSYPTEIKMEGSNSAHGTTTILMDSIDKF